MMCLPSTDDEEGNDFGAGTSTTSTVYCDDSSFSPVSSLLRLMVDSTHLIKQTEELFLCCMLKKHSINHATSFHHRCIK